MAKTQHGDLLTTLQRGFKYIEEQSFESKVRGLFSEIYLASEKLGRTYSDRNAKLCAIISEIAHSMALFPTGSDMLGDPYEYPGLLRGGEPGDDGPAGIGMDADAFSPGQESCRKPGPGARTCRPRMGGKRQAGCRFLLVNSLYSGPAWPFAHVPDERADQQKRSNSPCEEGVKRLPPAKPTPPIQLQLPVRAPADPCPCPPTSKKPAAAVLSPSSATLTRARPR
jgi:hypothetical protein